MKDVNLLFKMEFGSHLYGTQTPESDKDYVGIYLPNAREIVLGNYQRTIEIKRAKAEKERNTKDDTDIDIFSYDRYLKLLAEGQTVAMDILFGYKPGPGTELMDIIYENKDKILNRNVNAFIGYARQQAARYGVKGSRMDALKRVVAVLETLPEKDKLFLHADKIAALVKECSELISMEKTPLVEVIVLPGGDKKEPMPHLHVCGKKVPYGNYVKSAKELFSRILECYGERAHKAHLVGGVDWKALSHAVRVNNEGCELLLTGHVTFPRPEAELLVKIKTGQLPFQQVAEMIEQGLVDLCDASLKSSLRDSPDQQFIDDLIVEVYSKVVREHV